MEARQRRRGPENKEEKEPRGNGFVFADKRSVRTLIAFRVDARDREICHGRPAMPPERQRERREEEGGRRVWPLEFLKGVKLCGMAARRRAVTVAAVITDSGDFQVPSTISYVDIPAGTSAR